METQTSPLGTIRREKLRTLQKNFTITTKTMPSFKKYAPKCARSIKIVRDDCPKTTSPHLKCVNGFSFILHGYSQNRHRLQKNQIFKIIKHHKKFIQSCKGIQLTPQYTRELLQLRSFQFNYSYREPEEEYRALTFCRSLKSFSLDLKYGYSRTEIELITQIEKNKHKIQRALRNMKSIRKLSLKFKSQCVTSLFIFLQLFGSCPLFLSRLKFFDFDLFSCDETYYPDEDFTRDVNVRMALRFITHLAIFNHTLFEMIIFDPELMGNLTNLTMRISAHKDCSEETIKKLSMLKLLPKLKELDLGFTSGSKLKEKVFLESFSLPKHIETVILRLTNFIWKDLSLKLTKENRRIIEEKFEEHPRFQRFYNEWASLNHLHTLKLTINNRNDERKCPSLTLKFATGILKNLKDLKNLRYENDDTISLDENLSHKIIPIDLGVFWGMLKNSKKTLENLEIITDMNFFGKKDFQQEDFVGGFKRLKNVEMSGQVYWARNFGDFLSMIIVKEKIISVNVNSLCFKEEKYLNDFFENLARIPKNSDTTLEIDVSRLACSKWIENFCRFIDNLKVEGKLKLKMKGADGGVLKQEGRIRASVEKNPVFEELVVQYKSLMGRNKDLKF